MNYYNCGVSAVVLCLAALFSSATNQDSRWDPERFEETSKYAKQLAVEIINGIPFRGNERVLDIGSGDGKVSSTIALKVPNGKVLGIDPSRSMIMYAKENYPQSTFPNLSFELNDALHFQSKERFDIITSFTVLHMVSDQQQALNNFAHLLKPGGRLYCKFPVADGFGTALKQTLELPQWRESFAHYQDGWYFKSKKEYEQYIINAGLISVRVENQMLDEAYDSPQEMKDAVREWLPHIHALPQDKRELFLDDLFTLFLKEVPPDAQGKVHHHEPSLCIEAVKSL